jgi:hypothetical protein
LKIPIKNGKIKYPIPQNRKYIPDETPACAESVLS